MKKISLLALILIFTTCLSCERDDICAASTATTPNLIIEFFDVSNPENLKSVSNLLVIGTNNEQALSDNSATNTITLPLRTDQNSTEYRLWQEYELDDNGTPDDTTDDVEPKIGSGNIDIVTINYSKEDVYVSRACGYKTIFNNVTITIDGGDDDRWVVSRQSVNDNQSVEDETETHFYLYIN